MNRSKCPAISFPAPHWQEGPISDYLNILFSSFAVHYDFGRDVWSNDPQGTAIARMLLARLGGNVAHHVLDVGAGRARHAELFLSAGHRYTGVDLLAHSDWTRISRAWRGRVRLVSGPFLDWRVRERFTAALDCGCFHHQHPRDYPAYLAHLRSMLRTGSEAAFCLYTPTDPLAPGEMLRRPDGRLARYFTAGEFREIVEPAGFRLVETRRLQRAADDRFYMAAIVRATPQANFAVAVTDAPQATFNE